MWDVKGAYLLHRKIQFESFTLTMWDVKCDGCVEICCLYTCFTLTMWDVKIIMWDYILFR